MLEADLLLQQRSPALVGSFAGHADDLAHVGWRRRAVSRRSVTVGAGGETCCTVDGVRGRVERSHCAVSLQAAGEQGGCVVVALEVQPLFSHVRLDHRPVDLVGELIGDDERFFEDLGVRVEGIVADDEPA